MRENIPTEEEMRAALIERHGEEIQQRFAAASVAVCGLGGLGSNIAIALARAGVGHLHLIDFDRVDISNLNRQQYEAAQIGQYKTEALAGNLRKIAPYIKITTDTVRITAENATELLQGEEIICEAFDSAEAKAMLGEPCARKHERPIPRFRLGYGGHRLRKPDKDQETDGQILPVRRRGQRCRRRTRAFFSKSACLCCTPGNDDTEDNSRHDGSVSFCIKHKTRKKV